VCEHHHREDQVRLLDVTVARKGAGTRMTGLVERADGGERFEAYLEYGVDAEFVGNGAEAFAAAMLLPAMRAGEDLRVPVPVSPRLCVMLPRVRDVFHTWWPELARVDIDLTPADIDRRPPATRTATFFSGGVDSFYSLLKNRGGHGSLTAPLTHLIFMKGVETPLEWLKGVAQTETWIREVAAATGTNAIVGETNIRTVLQGPEDNLRWERHYHGSALAAAALGLSPGFAFVCIPSSFSYNHLVPFGSTPLVDEMFSTERLQVIHDGAEAIRPAKVARIVEWNRELVLSHLRVCIENRSGAKNCGRCKKCVRTAVALRALGVWDQAGTFPNKRCEHWTRVMEGDHLAFVQENLQFVRDRAGDAELIAMITAAIGRRRRRETLKGLFERPPLRRLRPIVLRAKHYWDSQPH
jgi:hypothetical protein